MHKLGVAVALAVVAVSAGAAGAERTAPPLRYVLTDLGAIVGRSTSSLATGINLRGQVIGQVRGTNGYHGVLWQNGTATIIDPSAPFSRVADINDDGEIVGDSFQPPDGDYAFVWKNGSLTKLGTLGGRSASAVAINNRGQVIGNATTASGATHAFIWESGRLTDLGTLGGDSAAADAVALNDRGQVVGMSTTPRGAVHAFLWQSGVMRDLGTISGLDSRPVSINARGDIAGFANPPAGDPTHAVLWRNGRLTDLGRFGARTKQAMDSDDPGLVRLDAAAPRRAYVWRGGRTIQVGPLRTFAVALNDLGQVVGRYPAPHRRNALVPFIWKDRGLTRLPELDGVGPPYGSVYALNDQGSAVGDSYTEVGGHTFDHAVMWTPRR